MSTSTFSKKYWLLKAEPDSRVTKGKDVKFSVDDFEHIKTSPWEGVRNFEARNLMKEMKAGEKALFYHSNCKTPGIAAFAEVAKEAYPDYTAWDASHPYFDQKSKSDDPKWFMVDLTFTSRAKHFIPLALLRLISELPPSDSDIPEEIGYIGEDGVKAIQAMDLVTRGRLSVQRVSEEAWNILVLMSEKGGWEEMDLRPKMKGSGSKKVAGSKKGKSKVKDDEAKPSANRKGKAKKAKKVKDDYDEGRGDDDREESKEEEVQAPTRKSRSAPSSAAKRKRENEEVGLRRSTRARK